MTDHRLIANRPPKLKVLRLLLTVEETSAPYNQFSRAWANKQKITICTFFPPKIVVDESIMLYSGEGSISGYWRVLRKALADGCYDVIHSHSPHVGFLLVLMCLVTDFKLLRIAVYTVHSSYANYKLRNRLMMLPIFGCMQAIVCCSNASLSSFPSLYKRLGGERLQVIQNGVDLERIQQATHPFSITSDSHPFRLLTVGRLIPLKRPLFLLKVLHQSASSISELVFVGEGSLQAQVEAEITALALDSRVRLTGLLPREAVYKQMQAADVFISVSTIEGLPVAVLEAMANKCPVILSNIPAHAEVAEGVDFIPLIDLDDRQGFTKEIDRFVQMDEADRLAIGEACCRLAQAKFSLQAMYEKYQALYVEIKRRAALLHERR